MFKKLLNSSRYRNDTKNPCILTHYKTVIILNYFSNFSCTLRDTFAFQALSVSQQFSSIIVGIFHSSLYSVFLFSRKRLLDEKTYPILRSWYLSVIRCKILSSDFKKQTSECSKNNVPTSEKRPNDTYFWKIQVKITLGI